MTDFRRANRCRGCGQGNKDLRILLDLGIQAVIKFKQSHEEKDDRAPLTLTMCPVCKLVQLNETVDQDRMFRDYHYVSGINSSMRASLLDIVKHAEALVDLGPGDLVVDIGSNDGTLLRSYRTYIHKLGFEPARNIPYPPGIDVIWDYFSLDQAQAWTDEYGKAKVITAIAMFYDLDDPNKFCADVKKILHEDGIFIIQMNYLGAMIKNLTIDNISHEHLCYYSFKTLHQILKNNGFDVYDVSFNDVNGGSIRVVAKHKPGLLTWNVIEESEKHLEEISTYVDWARRLDEIRKKILAYITLQKSLGKSVWGYGASTRGNTLLQWLGLDFLYITKIADRNPAKWGKFTAGGNIPICSEEEMRAAQPDNLLMLPYHFRSEFIEREAKYLENGGRMLFPLPIFRIYRTQFQISMDD